MERDIKDVKTEQYLQAACMIYHRTKFRILISNCY
jgi:hypothetical protein